MRVLALIFPVITIDSSEALPKKRKTDEINSTTEMELWLEFCQLRLCFEDKEIIKNGSAVNDRIMNFAVFDTTSIQPQTYMWVTVNTTATMSHHFSFSSW